MLQSESPSTEDLGRLLETETAIEFEIRRNDLQAAARLTEQALATHHPRSIARFVQDLKRFRSNGLPGDTGFKVEVDRWNSLPYLTARFELPVDEHRLAETIEHYDDDLRRMECPERPSLCLVCGLEYSDRD